MIANETQRHPDRRIPRAVSPPLIVCCLSDAVANEACGGHQKVKGECAWISAIVVTHDEMEMAHLRMNGCAGTALPSKWSIQSSQRIKIDHSSPSNDVGGRVWRVVGGLGDGWQVAGKLQKNWCEEATFLQIEKVTKLKAERGTLCWLQTSNLTPASQLLLEWSVEKGLVKRDGRWWSERWSSTESVWGLRFSYIFNRSFELAFTHD
jgi:hypothetical protein